MADNEETTVTIDEQGRLVLPSLMREKLGIKKGGRVLIRTEDSSRIVLERKADQSIEERVKDWVELALSEKAEIGPAYNAKYQPISNKWMSSEYARRKLGL